MDEVIKIIKERKELIDMNEEEKKAIERFKANANYCITSKETTQTILNLIKKQQKELEKLETKNNDLLRKLRNRIKDVKKLQKYGQYKNEFSNLNKKIAKKDEIIDLMAELIEECRANGCIESEEIDISEIAGGKNIIDYFTNLVEKENK